MALQSGPLESGELSEALKKVVGPAAPPQLRMMAARGMAPLGPADLATAIYQLSRDTDTAIAQAADRTAGALPDKILQAALPARLDARVLDFFAHKVALKPHLVELVILNPASADESFVYLASVCTERELELLAANEERILRTPKIIEALYFNRSARMSTVDRLIELAVRHGIRCEGIPQFEAAAEAIREQGPPVFDGRDFEIDQQFRAAADAAEVLDAGVKQRAAATAGGDQGVVDAMGTLMTDEDQPAPEEELGKKKRIQELPMSGKLRLAAIGNAAVRLVLVKDPNKVVAMAAVNSPALSDLEAVAISQNRAVTREVLGALARNRNFLKMYQVKLSLAFNPKCPLDVALKVIQHLHEADVRKLAKSKNVPAQVSAVARRIVETRERKS